MRTALVWIVSAEGVALLVAAVALLLGYRPDGVAAPIAPVFRPPIHDAVIGDFVRYQRLARTPEGEDGEVLGYVEYKVMLAVETEGTTLGRTFLIEITHRDAKGSRVLKRRQLGVRPRDLTQGFFPPRFDEEERPLSVLPVVKTIRTAEVPFLLTRKAGFLVETVVPREGLTKVQERYWFSVDAPVFGVTRWERRQDVLVLHAMERASR